MGAYMHIHPLGCRFESADIAWFNFKHIHFNMFIRNHNLKASHKHGGLEAETHRCPDAERHRGGEDQRQKGLVRRRTIYRASLWGEIRMAELLAVRFILLVCGIVCRLVCSLKLHGHWRRHRTHVSEHRSHICRK